MESGAAMTHTSYLRRLITISVAVVVTLTLALVAQAPAASAAQRSSNKYFYMVANVQQVNGFTTGDFALVRRVDKQFSGAVGAFASEHSCFSGTLRKGKIRGVSTSAEVGTTPFRAAWLGSGTAQHFRGYTNVSASELKRLSDGFVTKSWARACFS